MTTELKNGDKAAFLGVWGDNRAPFQSEYILLVSFVSKKTLKIRFAVNLGIGQCCSTKDSFLFLLELINLQRLTFTSAWQPNLPQEEGVLLLSFNKERLLGVASAAFS